MFCKGFWPLELRRRVAGATWRFMGSYNRVTSPLVWVISIVILLITLLVPMNLQASKY